MAGNRDVTLIFMNAVSEAERENAIEDVTQLMTVLKLNRVDVVLIERWMGISEGRRLGIADLRALEPPLARREMFLYLHKTHERLIPDIADALRGIKADGTYQRLLEQTIVPLTR